jgi:hypothetical protein
MPGSTPCLLSKLKRTEHTPEEYRESMREINRQERWMLKMLSME